MEIWLADPPFFGGAGQGTRQIVELFVAFGLTALIGLEREIQGKSAGLRTQTIVGTAAALILLVSKYGFPDVLVAGTRRGRPVARRGPNRLGHRLSRCRHHHLPPRLRARPDDRGRGVGVARPSAWPRVRDCCCSPCTVTAMHFLIVLGFMPLAKRLSRG